MVTNIPDTTISRLSEFIAKNMGLHFPEAKWSDLERGIKSAAPGFGHKDTEEFINWLLSAPLTRRHIEVLASHLTVGETFFFRDKESFRVLEEQVLPEIISTRQESGKRLRIWSAGCCTGEEPYSIAILLNRLLPDMKDWNITILGTDINIEFLRKAADGLYTEWSFRSTPRWVVDGYFKKDNKGRYRISPSIRKMVSFEYLNLAEDIYPSLLNNTNALDLIICRNVLMYFSEDHFARIIGGFYKSLIEHGWLVVSPTEPLRIISTMFYPANIPDTTMYRKERRGTQKAVDMLLPETGLYGICSTTSYSPALTAGSDYEPGSGLSSQGTSLPCDVVMPPDISKQAAQDSERPECQETASTGADETHKQAALLSRRLANHGLLDEAVKCCETAISGEPFNPAYRYLLATILQEQGCIDEAVKSLRHALYLDGNFALAYFMLGSIMQRTGKIKESIKCLRNASDLLSSCEPESIVPETEGITAERMIEVIDSMIQCSPASKRHSAAERQNQ